MEVEYSSEELALVKDTVVSRSPHDDLMEGVDYFYHHSVIAIQRSIHETTMKVLQELEEARKRKTLGSNTEVTKLQKRLKILRESKDRAIARMGMLRDATIASLKKWEEHNVSFGEGVE